MVEEIFQRNLFLLLSSLFLSLSPSPLFFSLSLFFSPLLSSLLSSPLFSPLLSLSLFPSLVADPSPPGVGNNREREKERSKVVLEAYHPRLYDNPAPFLPETVQSEQNEEQEQNQSLPYFC
jgi:hypothetical protein